MPQTEAQKAASRRFRAKQKALGIKPKGRTPEQKAQNAEAMRKRREQAKAAGIVLPSDTWWKDNPEKHREKTRRWRENNLDRHRELTRRNQADRRSTPWGAINNRMWRIVHDGVRTRSAGWGKYNVVLGYTWHDLAIHLEGQFRDGMTWDNWGPHWELDHIKRVSEYRYESIQCPTFKECWGLTNLRPLLRHENQQRR